MKLDHASSPTKKSSIIDIFTELRATTYYDEQVHSPLQGLLIPLIETMNELRGNSNTNFGLEYLDCKNDPVPDHQALIACDIAPDDVKSWQVLATILHVSCKNEAVSRDVSTAPGESENICFNLHINYSSLEDSDAEVYLFAHIDVIDVDFVSLHREIQQVCTYLRKESNFLPPPLKLMAALHGSGK